MLRATLFAAALALLAAPLHAATFGFSFSNEDGPVAGTVEGTLELPDGDGTFAATSVIVTSAPAALGYTLPLDVLASFAFVPENSFTVVAGTITAATFAAATFGVPYSALALGFQPGTFGSLLNAQETSSEFSGVADIDDSTLTFTALQPVPVPPAAALVLTGLAGLGALKRRRAA